MFYFKSLIESWKMKKKKKKMMKPPQFTQILSNLKKVGEMLMNGYVTEHVISQADSV